MNSTNFPASSFLPDQETPVLLQDLSRVFRQLGVQFVHASVVDLASMTLQANWSIAENGAVSDSAADRSLDSAFPGAAASIGQLARFGSEHTMVQKLSPRRWAYAWRLDERSAVLAEAQYHERREAVSEIDTALVRMVCSASIRRGDDARTPRDPVQARLWPQVDRRARPKPSRTAWLTVALACVAALLAAWVALAAAPAIVSAVAAQRARVDMLQKMADATLSQRLAAAMASGDYGEAQIELDQFQGLGYFQSAVVVNGKSRVVAMSGRLEKLRIGDPPTAAYETLARPLELALGSERYGRLLLVSAPVPPVPGWAGLQLMSLLAAAAALVTAVLLAARLRRAWR